MNQVTVIDSIMGSGKTTWMMNRINSLHSEGIARAFEGIPQGKRRYLYITPSLDEVDRVTKECAALDFRDPQPVDGKKYYHLDTLIQEGRNICTTHSLFKLLTRATYEKLKHQGYTLICDEVLGCVELYKSLTKQDQEHLFSNSMLSVDLKTNRLQWNEDKYHGYQGRFTDVRDLCRNGNLVQYGGKMLLWEFPTEFIRCFEHVYILTYLFQGSPMSSYLAADGQGYQMMAVQKGSLVQRVDVDESAIKEKLRELLTIYEGPANRIGAPIGKENPLSSSWFDRSTDQQRDQLRASTENFFKKVSGTPSKLNAWTTFKSMRPRLKGERYSRGFLPVNLRATNDYVDKEAMAYLANIFYLPYIKGYFESRGVPVHEELYALSEMLQWLWRGQIRRGDPMHVFIPSKRMRELLLDWLSSNAPGG